MKRKNSLIKKQAESIVLKEEEISPSKINIRWFTCILFVFTFLLYANTLNHKFALDDAGVITENKLVQQGVSAIPTLVKTTLFYGLDAVNKETWRPLTMILFAIEKDFLGNDASHFHWINVLLYCICIVLLFNFFFALTGKKILPAFAISLLFAGHPLHTEVVANIKSRDEILSLLFAIISAWTCLLYIKKSKLSLLLLASSTFLFACFCKESAITFAIIIPLLLYFFLDFPIQKIKPIFFILLASVVAYLASRYFALGVFASVQNKISPVDNVLFNEDFSVRIATAFVVLGRYIKLLVFPHPLVHDYSFNQIPVAGFDNFQNIISFLVLLLIFSLCMTKIKTKNKIALGVLIFFVSISIVSNIFIPIGVTMAERLLFVPSLGFCIALVYGIFWISKTKENTHSTLVFNKPLFYVPILLIVLFYSIKTISRNTDWKDNYTLFSRDIKNAKKSCRAHYNLGTSLWRMSQVENNAEKKAKILQQALSEFNTTLDIYPQYPEATINLANVYHELGDYDKEMQLLGTISSEKQGQGLLFFNAGNALLAKGNYQEAITQYKKAIAGENVQPDAFTGISVAYSAIGMFDDAIENCKKAITLNPKSVEAIMTLGSAYSGKKESKKAIEQFKKAIAINEHYGEAWINLGNAYVGLNDFSNAEKALLKGTELKPDLPQAFYNLAYCFLQQKKYNESTTTFLKALKLKPDYIECYINLGYLSTLQEKYNESITYYQKAIAIDPNNKNCCLGISYCYSKLGDKNSAELWRKNAEKLSR